MKGTTSPFPVLRTALLLAVLLSTAPALRLLAQPTASKSGGTSGSTYLLGTTSGLRSQMLYTSTDLVGAQTGLITTVYFRHHAAAATNTMTNLVVRLGQTANVTFSPSTTFYTGLTTVYTGNFIVPTSVAAGDWFAIPLATPYFYSTTQTLIVEVVWDACTNTSFSTRYTTGPGSPNYKKLYSSSTTATTGTTSTTWQDFGMTIATPAALDAALIGFTAPASPLCPGSSPVTVTLANFGTTTLTSATINWELNSVAQTPYAWSGSLASMATTTVTIGSGTFSGTGSHAISATVTSPNGGTDGNTANDQTTLGGFQTSLTGVFTIGGTSPDFPTFTAARNALVARGVCGPVTFNVRPGVYTEQVSFPAITGASASNTVTFQSESGDSTSVTLTYAATATTDNFVVELVDVAWLRLRKMTLASTGSSYSRVLTINGPAQNIIVAGNVLQAPPASSTSNNFAVIFNITGTAFVAQNVTVENNRILNGSYGLYWYGGSSSALESGHVIRHNEISGFYYYGMTLYYQDGIVVENNTVTGQSVSPYTTQYGMDLNYCDGNTRFTRNKVSLFGTSTNYGMYVYYCDGTSSTAPGLVANNTVSLNNATGTAYGMYVYYSLNQDIVSNSISVNCGSTTAGRALYFYSPATGTYGNIRSFNNIAVNTGGGVAVEVVANSVTLGYLTASNNNNFYVTGTVLGNYGATPAATLAAWQTASGKDAASISANPGFVSATDLHVTSPAMNAAAQVHPLVLVDMDGELRHATTPDIGADEYTPITVDAGVVSIDDPVAPCPGSNPVSATIRNFGLTAITSVTVNWSVNGVPQTPYSYSGSLAAGLTATIPLGSYTFLTGTSYTIVVSTSMPNGVVDPNTSNDGVTRSGIEPAISGTFTIGGTSPDFATFAAARDALVARGVCGPVTFNVRSGSYNEQMSFPAILGASTANTITFQSETGDSSAVTLTWAATGTGDNYVVELIGGGHLRFRQMSLVATNATYGRVIVISGPSENVVFSSNLIQGVTATGTSTNVAVIYNASGAGNLANNIVLENNRILNGSYALYWYGGSSSVLEANNVIRHNTITDFYYYGVNLYYQDNILVENNVVTAATSAYTTNYGMDINYCDNASVFTRNRITLYGTTTNYGMYLYYSDGTSTTPMLVSNNFVALFNATGTAYGIYSYYSSYQDIINNSIHVACGSTTAGRALYFYSAASGAYGNVRSLNNIAVNTGGGVAVEVYSSAVTLGYLAQSNNNCYYATGALLGRWGATDAPTIGDWRTASSLDAAALSIDPGFTSASDLHASAFPLNGAALPVATVLLDVDGELRNTSTPDIGADEFTPITFDAGVASIDNPVNPCPGPNAVSVTIRNYGLQNITSVDVAWTVNGIAQTPVQFTGVLAPGNTTSIALGSYTFVAGVPYTITASTSMPNGLPDLNTSNDAASIVDMQTALSGTLTIGGTSPNYATFADAASSLNTYGVCGPVTFNVRTGTYPEQMLLGEIAGTSATNRIIFQSESGVRTDVNLTWAGTGTGDNYVVQFNGADYVTVRNMTMTATGPDYGRVVQFNGMSDGVRISNCVMQGVYTATTSSNTAVIYNTSGAANMVNDCTIENSDILGGSYSMYWYGSSSTVLETGNVFDNNRITGFYYYGPYLYYQDAPVITNNLVRSSSTPYTTTYGIYPHYCENRMILTGNTVTLVDAASNYGIYVYYSDATLGNESLVANNFITVGGTSTTYGLYSYYSTFQRYYHNTVVVLPGASTSSRALYMYYGNDLDLKNNIAANFGGGFAIYTASTTNIAATDFNNLYTSGSVLGYWGANQADLAAWQGASGGDASSVSRTVTFLDASNGDLHLAGASMRDLALRGTVLSMVGTDIDGDTRSLPFMGADEGCYIPAGNLSYEIVDQEGTPTGWAQHPGTMYMRVNVAYPTGPSTVTVTVRYYDLATNQLRHTATFVVQKLANTPLSIVQGFSLPANIPSGYYRMEVDFHTITSCGTYATEPMPNGSTLLVSQGQTPCLVWPGDVNNDGLVNYGDRASLNKYIFNANLRPTWLTGPARYRADAATNPTTYLTWEAQPATPWFTTDGCYMDADGNGTVNNYDQLAVKFNYLRSHGTWTPKQDDALTPSTFDMAQNYPNPFNPATTLQFSVPERSTIRLVVTDMLGREIATLVDGTIEAGIHTRSFDGSAFGSGMYLASITMTGQTSGSTFSKVIRMSLNK